MIRSSDVVGLALAHGPWRQRRGLLGALSLLRSTNTELDRRKHFADHFNAFVQGFLVPKFKIDIPHSLDKEEVRSRLGHFTEALVAKSKDQVSDLSQSWSGDTLSFGFKTFGIKIAGDIHVQDDRLAVDGELPFSAMMFKGKIESEIKAQLGRLVKA